MKIVIKLKQLFLDNIMPPFLIISLLCELFDVLDNELQAL